jgi:hypothetical protein
MEEIFEIKILRESGFNEIDYFGLTGVLPRLNKYIVDLVAKEGINEFGEEVYLFGVSKKTDITFLGFFRIVSYPIFIVFTFYVSNDENKREFSKFIRSTINDLEFSGFPIQDSRSLGEDPIIVEDENDIYLPKTPAAIERWRRIFALIEEMKDEASNSDDWEGIMPTLADYRDRVIDRLGIRRSERTISDIIKAGAANLLN